jgi:hypothetical protein
MVRKSCAIISCRRKNARAAAYCFVTQLELQVHVDKPVDKNGAHAIRYIRLRRHVIGAWLVLDLKLAQVLVNVLDVLDHVVGLIAIGCVDVEYGHSRSDLTTKKAFKTAHKSITVSYTRAKS